MIHLRDIGLFLAMIFCGSIQLTAQYEIKVRSLPCDTTEYKIYGSITKVVKKDTPREASKDSVEVSSEKRSAKREPNENNLSDELCSCTGIAYQATTFFTRNKGTAESKKQIKNAKGGLFHIYISRPTIGAVAPENFFLTFKNKKGKQKRIALTEKRFRESGPTRLNGVSKYWANEGFVLINYELGDSFSITLEDRFNGESIKYKFLITE